MLRDTRLKEREHSDVVVDFDADAANSEKFVAKDDFMHMLRKVSKPEEDE
jgi:hypothetical protein